jgi:hypothetical protein
MNGSTLRYLRDKCGLLFEARQFWVEEAQRMLVLTVRLSVRYQTWEARAARPGSAGNDSWGYRSRWCHTRNRNPHNL